VGRAAGNPIRIDDDVFISGLSDLTEAVHRHGAKMAAQLHHAGRQNGSSNTVGGKPAVGPSAIASAAIGETPRALDISEIPGIVKQFADGARRAKAAGFDMVEIHGSHGYILTQFLSPQSNLRTDAYGGSFENRARFPLEVVQAVREAVGPDYPVSYRISIEERTQGGMEADEGIAFCKMIEPYVDVFNVTVATYESMDSIFTMQGVVPGSLLKLAARVKSSVSKPIIGISRLGWALDEANEAVASGELDFVAMARTQLADPALITKTLNGQPERVRRCIACNECVGGFLFKGWRVHCVINPELGYEYEMKSILAPVAQAKKVTVVGGGVAGCEAARAAALRGHKVTVLEQSDRLGGWLRSMSALSIKQREIESLIGYYEAELAYLGVKVELNHTATADDPKVKGADAVVLATGFDAPALESGELDALEVLRSRNLPDGDVEIRGTGELALTAAAWASEQGRKTTLVTGGADLGAEVNPILAGHLGAFIERNGGTISEKSTGGAKVVLNASHRVPDSRTWAVPGAHEVGGRAGRSPIYDAVQSGFWTGTQI
jgi:2,4-dienoyl-CoA reductase (NADPH2)